MRIVIAEDSAVMRAGLAEILADSGHQVVAAVGSADDLLAAVDQTPKRRRGGRADAARLHRRGPARPMAVRRDHPTTGVLVFSQYIESRYTADLLGAGSGRGAAGVGYLLKDRVGDVEEFVEALSRVAAGARVEPEVVTQLLGASRRNKGLGTLTAREREVLELMARAVPTPRSPGSWSVRRSVEKHVGNIFSKLGLPPSDADNRRVLAVLRYLGS